MNDDDVTRSKGPGSWADADMLQVCNFGQGGAAAGGRGDHGMTLEEYRAEYSIWAVFASPMIISANLVTVCHRHNGPPAGAGTYTHTHARARIHTRAIFSLPPLSPLSSLLSPLSSLLFFSFSMFLFLSTHTLHHTHTHAPKHKHRLPPPPARPFLLRSYDVVQIADTYPDCLAMLKNKELISISQDPLGAAGKMIRQRR